MMPVGFLSRLRGTLRRIGGPRTLAVFVRSNSRPVVLGGAARWRHS